MGADGVTCVCKSGYKKINGVCSKEESTTTQTKKTCTIPNRIQNADGSCSSECESGYVKNADGTCAKKKTCTISKRIPNADGSCSSECESGYELQSDGTCKVKEETTIEPSTDPDEPDLPDELMP